MVGGRFKCHYYVNSYFKQRFLIASTSSLKGHTHLATLVWSAVMAVLYHQLYHWSPCGYGLLIWQLTNHRRGDWYHQATGLLPTYIKHVARRSIAMSPGDQSLGDRATYWVCPLTLCIQNASNLRTQKVPPPTHTHPSMWLARKGWAVVLHRESTFKEAVPPHTQTKHHHHHHLPRPTNWRLKVKTWTD